MPRKRTRDEMEAAGPEEKKAEPSLLQKIRNMWEFASVMQFIFMFGKAVKIDEDFDIEDFENECLKPGYSEKLEDIGLTLLKWISSHRGLNLDIWDEYTRRQYLAKAPQLNPYGDDEEPKRFRDFDIFTKIRVLHQLTVWTFWNPERLRERMPEHPREVDQLEWRVEEFGYDRDDRQYYLLDDNRFYRRTDPPLPAGPKAKPKANSKKAIAARRRESKRRKIESETPEVDDGDHEGDGAVEETQLDPAAVDTLGGYKWECVAITLPDYHELCESLKKAKDPNEKALRERLVEEVIPIIEAAEEKQRRKIERRERELMMMERMVGAKRSGRLADKHDRERREAEQAEAERKRKADLAAARLEQERQEKMEEERRYRMMTREQRIKDREFKRLLKEEELARDELEQKRIEEGQVRGSERHVRERMERNKKELEELAAEDEWTFDCSGCGKYGKNLDDGSHSVACERCSVWQHSKCLGISKSAAEKDDFHFVCKDCKQKEEDAKKPKISLKFRVGTSSPAPSSPVPAESPHKLKFVAVEIPATNTTAGPSSQGSATNGSSFQQSSPPTSQPVQHNGFHHPGPSQSSPRGVQYASSVASHNGSPSSQRQQPQPDSSPIRFNPTPGVSGNSYQQPSHPHVMNDGPSTNPPSQAGGYQFVSHNGPSYQYPNHPPGSRPSANTPRQPSQPQTLGQSVQRLPSPVINRPTMSPTQGNMDVGFVAGMNHASSQHNAHQTVGAANGYPQPATNGIPSQSQATPRPPRQSLAQTPTPQPLSGLSPKKQQTPVPLPPPSMIPHKSTSMSPPLPAVSGEPKRSVSGTPILPPVENLKPSPEQLRNMSSNEPVPTPSKHSPPGPQSVDVGMTDAS